MLELQSPVDLWLWCLGIVRNVTPPYVEGMRLKNTISQICPVSYFFLWGLLKMRHWRWWPCLKKSFAYWNFTLSMPIHLPNSPVVGETQLWNSSGLLFWLLTLVMQTMDLSCLFLRPGALGTGTLTEKSQDAKKKPLKGLIYWTGSSTRLPLSQIQSKCWKKDMSQHQYKSVIGGFMCISFCLLLS